VHAQNKGNIQTDMPNGCRCDENRYSSVRLLTRYNLTPSLLEMALNNKSVYVVFLLIKADQGCTGVCKQTQIEHALKAIP